MSEAEKLGIFEFLAKGEKALAAGKILVGALLASLFFVVSSTAWSLDGQYAIHSDIEALKSSASASAREQQSIKAAVERVSDREQNHHTQTLTTLVRLADKIGASVPQQ